jgi:23S rRNA pseudouridine955/2504/2580 synthase
MREIVISKNEAGQRLNKLLMKYLDRAPSSFVYKMLRKKNIKLNDSKAVGNEIVYVGDVIKLYLSDETIENFKTSEDKASPKNKNAFVPEIIYRDEDILAVDKPIGILSQKAKPDDYSVNEAVIDWLISEGYIDSEQLQTFKPSICNRLDRNTSGIVLCGISLRGSQELSRIIRQRKLDKYYFTIVKGHLSKELYVTGYLKKDNDTNKVTVVDDVDKNKAEEYQQVRAVFTPVSTNGKYTELKVKLITGKTHQIRAQLSHEGYPIVGDEKYGDRQTNIIFRQKYGLRCQLLHCGQVDFSQADGQLAHLGDLSISAFKPELYKKIEKDLFQK